MVKATARTHAAAATTTVTEEHEHDGDSDTYDAPEAQVVLTDAPAAGKKKAATKKPAAGAEKKARVAPVKHRAKGAKGAKRQRTPEEEKQRAWNRANLINPSAIRAAMEHFGIMRTSPKARYIIACYVSRIMRQHAVAQAEAATLRGQRTISIDDARLSVNRRSSETHSIY